MTKKIAFRGKLGAYAHTACRRAFPKLTPLPCATLAAALKAVETGKADMAMIPVDNSIAGPVAEVAPLLQKTKLAVVAEHFLPVHHCLLGVKGAKISDIKTVYSHTHALAQCRKIIKKLKLKTVAFADTAGSAQKVAQMKNVRYGAIASAAAAKLYGLKILKRNIEDKKGNTTRFVTLARAGC